MSNRAKTLLLLIVDFALLFLILTGVIYFRGPGEDPSAYLFEHYNIFSYIFPFWLLMYFIEGLYTLRTYNPATLSISVIRTTILSVLISIIVIYLFPNEERDITPKTNLVLIALLNLPLLYVWRKFFFKFFSQEYRLRETVLLGSEETLKLVHEEIERKPYLGYKIVNEITANTQLIAIERNIAKDSALFQRIFSMLGSGVEVMDLASFAEKISGKIPIRAIDETWFVEYCGHQESRSYDVIKNLFDRTVAILLLILCIPLAIVLIPLLLFLHGRPIVFKQTRVGVNNKLFTLYKLRTMVLNAEKTGAMWATPGDSRITKLGKILRKSRIDELPQLINILRGEMSLVGPRPERPEMINNELAPNIPYYNLRHLVKPGVTGWAQVTFRYGYSIDDSKEKLQFDLFYVKNRSAWLDLLVFLKTIKTVLTGAGQ